MTTQSNDDLDALNHAWAPRTLSPPLRSHAAILMSEIRHQITALGKPGARQHFLIHGPDRAATARLSTCIMQILRDEHPDLRIVRLNHHARVYGTVGGIFDSLISSITGSIIPANLAAIAERPVKKLWKDKIHDFLTIAMQPKDTGEETRGVLIFADDYDALLEEVFDTPEKESFLRAFLQDEAQVIFVGVSHGQKLDSDPDDRIFRLFRRYELPLPAPEEMFETEPVKTPDNAALMATVAILGTYERPFLTTLQTIDWSESFDLTRVAQTLIDVAESRWRSEINQLSSTRLAILKALVLLGEPATASEIANRLNVSQSRIARDIRDMREEAILVVQSLAGRAKHVALAERGMALAIKGMNPHLAFALNVAAGRFLAGNEIDNQITALIKLPRAKRYARLKKPWNVKAHIHSMRPTDKVQIDMAIHAAFLATLVTVFQEQYPDDMQDLQDAVETRSDPMVLSPLLQALLEQTPSCELRQAKALSLINMPAFKKERLSASA